jgi:predicted dehydrogenase
MIGKIRWGILSTAHVNRHLIPVIRASKRGEIVGVASRDGDKALAYSAQWDIPQAFSSYEAMLDSPDIDAVYISLPNHLHAEWSIRALQAGKHVLCEKPFAITVAEVDQMIAASHASGKVLQEAFMYRHHPQTRLVEEIIVSGRLGELKMVRSYFSYMMPEDRRPGNVRLLPEMGGGSLWDVGIYPISFCRRIFGDLPEIVYGSQWLGETGVDEVFAGQMAYPLGKIAQISCGFQVVQNVGLEVLGTEGRLELNRPYSQIEERGRIIRLVTADGRTEDLRPPKQELYLGQVENMHAAILDGEETLGTLEESRDHIRMATALYESAHTGEPVRIR